MLGSFSLQSALQYKEEDYKSQVGGPNKLDEPPSRMSTSIKHGHAFRPKDGRQEAERMPRLSRCAFNSWQQYEHHETRHNGAISVYHSN